MHLGKKKLSLESKVERNLAKKKKWQYRLRNWKDSNYLYANPSLVQDLTINCLGTAELDWIMQRLSDLDQYDVIRIPAEAENGLVGNQSLSSLQIYIIFLLVIYICFILNFNALLDFWKPSLYSKDMVILHLMVAQLSFRPLGRIVH